MLKQEEKRKQEETERKMLMKKRKEIEKQRKIKLAAIKSRMDSYESRDIEGVGV